MKFDHISNDSHSGAPNTMVSLEASKTEVNEPPATTLPNEATDTQDMIEGHNPESTARLSEPTHPSAPGAVNVHSHNLPETAPPERGPVSKGRLVSTLRPIFSINVKDEISKARLESMVQISIGDQIISFLDRSANAPGDSVKRANFFKAKRICEDFRDRKRRSMPSKNEEGKQRGSLSEEPHHADPETSNDEEGKERGDISEEPHPVDPTTSKDEQETPRDDHSKEPHPVNSTTSKDERRKERDELFKKLHHVDISPNFLAVEWLKQYAGHWWKYVRRRWTEIVNEESKKRNEPKRLKRGQNNPTRGEQWGRELELSSGGENKG
jgi:hypothetical protein